MRGKKYQTNNLITQNVEANEHTINYTTEEAIVLGQIFDQAYNPTKVIKNFGNKGLNAALAEVKELHGITCFRPIDLNKLTNQESK